MCNPNAFSETYALILVARTICLGLQDIFLLLLSAIFLSLHGTRTECRFVPVGYITQSEGLETREKRRDS